MSGLTVDLQAAANKVSQSLLGADEYRQGRGGDGCDRNDELDEFGVDEW